MYFLRGVEPYDSPTTVLVQRHEPQGVSSILSSTDFFQSEENRRIILERVDSFQLRDKYMFATTTRVRSAWRSVGLHAVVIGSILKYIKFTEVNNKQTMQEFFFLSGLHRCYSEKS